MSNYYDDAEDDAREAVRNFLDEIVDEIVDNENAHTAERQIDDFSESYHHETHVDRNYSLLEAAEILKELSRYEETDSGIWEGMEPKDAVIAMAAFTYGNAVGSMFNDFMEKIYNAVDEAVNDGIISWEMPENIEGRTDREEAWEDQRKGKIRRIVQKTAGLKVDRPEGKKEWRPED